MGAINVTKTKYGSSTTVEISYLNDAVSELIVKAILDRLEDSGYVVKETKTMQRTEICFSEDKKVEQQ